jgi:hypothetical protein
MSQEFKGPNGKATQRAPLIGEKNQYFGRQFSGTIPLNTVDPTVYPSRLETSCSGTPCG